MRLVIHVVCMIIQIVEIGTRQVSARAIQQIVVPRETLRPNGTTGGHVGKPHPQAYVNVMSSSLTEIRCCTFLPV